MNEWSGWGWHWEWLFQPKVYWTFGILVAWWGVSLFLGSRIGRFIGGK